jgi:hypothetical protein
MFLPYSFGTTGKYVVAPLFLLAVIRFFPAVFRKSRRVMASDFFVFATALWEIIAEITTTGSLSLATGSDAVGFVGTYMVARAFIFGERSLREFIRAFKFTTVTLIALSLLDTFSGRFFINDAIAVVFQGAPPLIVKGAGDIHRQLFGFATIRAASTFAHPILFGTFCSLAAAIFLYSEQRLAWRGFYVGVCFMGCALSISSAPLMAFAIIVSVASYDRILKRFPMRWKAFWATVVGLGSILFLLSDRPFSFVFDHFTFTPETGYYRLLIWKNAIEYIAIAPFTGDHVAWLSDDILGDSVDSVWLVLSLVYGLPAILFLLLATLAACVRLGRGDAAFLSTEMQHMRTAFSLVIAMFAFLGLTVHFWASIWLFWGLCLGIRVSIEEYARAEGGSVHKRSARRQIRPQPLKNPSAT